MAVRVQIKMPRTTASLVKSGFITSKIIISARWLKSIPGRNPETHPLKKGWLCNKSYIPPNSRRKVRCKKKKGYQASTWHPKNPKKPIENYFLMLSVRSVIFFEPQMYYKNTNNSNYVYSKRHFLSIDKNHRAEAVKRSKIKGCQCLYLVIVR